MKNKGIGFVIGVMLLGSTVHVGAASAPKTSKEEVDDIKPLRVLSREVADTIKTVHERELANRTFASRDLWEKRERANTMKTIQEQNLAERTVIWNDNLDTDEEVVE